MKKIFLPALLAAIAIFIWTNISWMVLPWHGTYLNNIPESAITEQLKTGLTEKGIYHYPGMPDDDKLWDEFVTKYETGPVVHFMVYDPSGIELMDPMQFVGGFLFNFFCALIAAFVLVKAINYKTGYCRRVFIVLLFGVFAALTGPMSMYNWWRFPFDYALINSIDMIVSWLIGGAVLAWRIRPEPAPLVD